MKPISKRTQESPIFLFDSELILLRHKFLRLIVRKGGAEQ
jgi:hypothetical protein